jgi:HAD superfamily hydrolase (TIGR01490 family)
VVGAIALRYKLKSLDFGQAHAQLMAYVGRAGYRETAQFFAEWLPRRLLPRLTPAGRAKVAWHRQQGHRVVILSASIEEMVKPAAAYLGLGQDYRCTYLAVVNNRYTGQVDGPVCYGAGKIYWANHWATEHGFSLENSYFYTDSSSDLPLLELVKQPAPVNPSRKLAKIARARGWPIERFY